MSDFAAWVDRNKALWTRVYDEVILPELEEEWTKQEEKQHALFNHLEDEILKNTHLRSEKTELQNQIADLSKSVLQDNDSSPRIVGASTVSAQDHIQLADKFNDLTKKYQDLSQKMKYLEKKNKTVMQKNKDMKESVRAWQEYADRQSERKRPKDEEKAAEYRPKPSAVLRPDEYHPHMPSSPPSVATMRTPLSGAGGEHSSPSRITPLAELETQVEGASVVREIRSDIAHGRPGSRSGSLTPKPSSRNRPLPHDQNQLAGLPQHDSTNLLSRGYPGRQMHPYDGAVNPSSSQTTEDETAEHTGRQAQHTAVDEGDEGDIPEFVSARCLKRKRDEHLKTSGRRHISSDGTPVKPYRVKEEPPSSPQYTPLMYHKDTIDLDDPPSAMLRTPHHRRHAHPIHATTKSTARHSRSSSAPLSQLLDPEVAQSIRNLTGPSLSLTVASDIDAELRAQSEPSNPAQNVTEVLSHVDPNIMADTDEIRCSKRGKRNQTHQETAQQSPFESGEEPPPAKENTSRHAPLLARAKHNCKLRNSTSPQSHKLGPAQISTPVATKIKTEPTAASPRISSASSIKRPTQPRLRNPQPEAHHITQETPSADGRPQWRMKAREAGVSMHKSMPSARAKQTTLRQKHLSELSLQDFKPNPALNQGYTYAFSETVRARGDRACLPGCTNPSCCGSTFRAFAEAQAPLPASQEQALLEDYLGDAYDVMSVSQMATEERAELVLQARTRKLAKEAGKHREAFERRRTPPGFWRMDFPTTQEEVEDREAAEVMARRSVKERWLEAMRKGGRWVFRDE
ncbi:hypothetical protein ACEQ8H_003332 [Pleosporales sp. CAS-2024a]